LNNQFILCEVPSLGSSVFKSFAAVFSEVDKQFATGLYSGQGWSACSGGGRDDISQAQIPVRAINGATRAVLAKIHAGQARWWTPHCHTAWRSLRFAHLPGGVHLHELATPWC